MPVELFTDTSAWGALAVRDDRHHQEAARAYPELLKRYRLVTTNLVVTESYALLRRKAGFDPAISFLEMVEASPRIRKVCSTPELEDNAYQVLKRHPDQDLSLTDAVSFVLMQEEKIKETLVFNHRFQAMGFILVP